MDFTEQQLSQINLKSLDSYKGYIINEYQQSLNKRMVSSPQQRGSRLDDPDQGHLDFIFSQKELTYCKKLIENKQIFKMV